MTLHPIPKQHSERIVIETQTERKWELRTKMIFNHDIFLIYFSNFNIDIDVSRTSLEIEPPRLPFRWNGEKILPSQPTLHSGEGFLCNVWGHYLFSSYVSFVTCCGHFILYKVGQQWIRNIIKNSTPLHCWLVACNLCLNDKKGMFLTWNWNPLSKIVVKNGD